MADSPTTIVNSALIKIGENPISSLEEDSEPAIKSRVMYPLRRDNLLRRYRWNFAMARATLSPEVTAPAFGFAQQYKTPADCLRVVGLYDEAEPQENYTTSRQPWKVEGNLLLTDNSLNTDAVTGLRIFYIRRITTTALHDPMFDEALAYDLAAELAYPISTGAGQAQALNEKFKEVIRQAQLADAIEGKPEMSQTSEWTDSRLQGTGLNNFGSRRFP